MDFDNVRKHMVNKAINIVKSYENGFIVTEENICKFNANIILNHFENIYNTMTVVQKSKINNLYNTII